jgi:hypothetical protein
VHKSFTRSISSTWKLVVPSISQTPATQQGNLNTTYSTLYHLHISSVSPHCRSICSPHKNASKTHQCVQTGNSAPRTATPLLSTANPMYGPTTGIFLAKPAIVPRKSPNKINIPYSSTRKPTKAQRMRMRTSPPKKAAVPLNFCGRAKKSKVF